MKHPKQKDIADWAELCKRDIAMEALCEGVSTERLKQLGDGWVKLVLDSIEKAGYFGY
jgi:hypothetical protein